MSTLPFCGPVGPVGHVGATTFIKICGITRVSDARAAVRSGANAVGFIFASSPRRVTPAEVKQISQHVHPSVRKFGVFVGSSIEKILAVVDEAGLDGVQLSGDQLPSFIEGLRKAMPSLFITKVIRAIDETSLEIASSFSAADAILFDPKDVEKPSEPSAPIPLDWLKEASVDRMIVAGGLDHQNVGDVVKAIRPWGVDVSSGVESSAGKKDPDKIRNFISAVREAELEADG